MGIHSKKYRTGVFMPPCEVKEPIIKLLTGKQCAEMIGVTYWVLKQMIDKGEFPESIRVGKVRLWREEKILKFIKKMGM
jgi:predicted DNA-binding transcriptional regulator AlpA